jgi:diguanylate cyclase (GGDEF)-like protein
MKADALLAVKTSIEGDDLVGLRLFADADFNSIAALLRGCPIHALRQEEVLLAQGATNSLLYLVLRGRLRVHLDSIESEPLRTVEAGNVVGEISLLDEKPISAFVVADIATTVLAVDRETFWALVNGSHAVARNMLTMMVERMRANNASISEGMQMRERYLDHANVDSLTGLRNLKAFSDLLRRQMLRSTMANKPLSVLMVDIDNFSDFNTEFGRAAGDHAIYTVAHALQDQLRPTDMLARVYGEKFAVLLPECDESGACAVAARIRAAISEALIMMDDGSILPPVTVSIGIAEMAVADNADTFLQNAEAALVRAKDSGRNAYAA